MTTLKYLNFFGQEEEAVVLRPHLLKVIDENGNQVEFDPQKVGFPKKWEVALAFTNKVLEELESPLPESGFLPPNGGNLLEFIINLIDRCP